MKLRMRIFRTTIALLALALTLAVSCADNSAGEPPKQLDKAWYSAQLPEEAIWENVAYGNGTFVATAEGDTSGNAIDTAAYSSDGQTWHSATLPESAYWKPLAYGNGTFVALAYAGADYTATDIAAYSTDGITWQSAALPEISYWDDIAYGNGVFVAISYDNTVAYSTDGETWASTSILETLGNEGIAFGDGRFLVMSAFQEGAWSTDGITWTAMTPKVEYGTYPCLYATSYSVAWGNGRFVAVGQKVEDRSGVATLIRCSAYSLDGENWVMENFTDDSNYWESVCYGDGLFVAVAEANVDGMPLATAIVSTDGLAWTPVDFPVSGNWFAGAYGNGSFVAVGYGDQAVYSD